MKGEDQVRYLFKISLSNWPKWQQFLICSSGFFFGYLINGIYEGFTPKQMVNPWKTYWKLYAVLMGSHGLTKNPFGYVVASTFPAAKLCKLFG